VALGVGPEFKPQYCKKRERKFKKCEMTAWDVQRSVHSGVEESCKVRLEGYPRAWSFPH
jgi:hypothetical protein